MSDTDLFALMDRADAGRIVMLRDRASGLKAMIALDDMTLGPACGGIRTRVYDSVDAAAADAQKLAAAMTLKCAIAGLPAGGGKTVVMDHPDMDRTAAFERLGRYIEDLGGLYRAAGDLGTTHRDLETAARHTRFVNLSGAALGGATGAGVVECIRALVRTRAGRSLGGLTVAIQGCGLIGAGVARRLHAEGARLIVADTDAATARALADELGAWHVDAGAILTVPADILCPCAVGGVITPQIVDRLSVWAICGGANNQLSAPSVAKALTDRGILFIPDFLASAGAVVAGAAQDLMGGADPQPLIRKLGETAWTIIERAAAKGQTTVEVGIAIARARIARGPTVTPSPTPVSVAA